MIYEIIEPLIPYTEALKSETRPILLYGMGNGAEKIYSHLLKNGIEIKGVVASDGFVRDQQFLGFTVKSISEYASVYGELCLVLCFGLEGEKSHFLSELAEKHTLISPNLPVFGDGVFDKAYMLENAEKLERLYSILEDDISKELFVRLLKYNITGDIGYIIGNEFGVAPAEFFRHDARHIDVGAYDGDTVAEFIGKSNSFSDVVAFEPDETTYKKLCANTSGVRDCICVNAAVGRMRGEISFASGGGRASHCGEGGSGTEMRGIDEFCGFTHINAEGVAVGSIKIDAEGMDEEVLYGAVNTIYCCKPNLAVALYHRAYDLLELPLLIRKHNPKYKFYLRKLEYVPAWDIFLYAIR
ncbi:MAG: FkbM family methyltransferase [Clostridia bacterium]|nr:FkbM family methyltransferase [Clostridia bacterium]